MERNATRTKTTKEIRLMKCEDVIKRGATGSAQRSTPNALLTLEADLRSMLRQTFCHPQTSQNHLASLFKAMDTAEQPTTGDGDRVMMVVEATLVQLVQMVRPYNTLLALIHHGYHHILHHLQAYVRKLKITELMLDKTDNPYGKMRAEELCRLRELESLTSELSTELENVASQRDYLKEQLSKAEGAFEEEHQKAVCMAEEKKKLEAHFLEAKVEAGGLKKKLENYLGEGPGSDPLLLKIALSKCREELASKARLLQDMERQYREVVPRADFDRQQRRLNSLTASHKQLSHVHEMLKEQHETLLSSYEQVVTERDGLSEENQALRRAATPRPEWNRVAEYIEGGISRWRELSFGKTSDQTVDVLISELTGSQLTTTSEFIDCKGNEPGVPAYLRYDGSVRNRRLGKRDLMLIVDDIWSIKRKLCNKDPMEHFVDQYFKERYHLEEVRAEWCYSLADGCQRLAHEEQIGLFWGILCGQVQEQVYHYQVDIVNNLYNILKSKDSSEKDLINRSTFLECIKEVFPLKTDDHIQVLMDIAARAASLKDPSFIKYHNLFPQGSGTERTTLVNEIVQQARDEQDVYIQEVLDELGYAAMDVAVHELSRALTIVDPRIEQRDLDAYLEWVFNTTRDQLKKTPPIPLPLLAARLQTGHIVRVGAKT
ncbi:translin-associated factor X-interacting protein 1-like isoform X2 [Macrobrachium nipponense]|uniref:translin-associated factor X-interacting protein 1-like isoform X2 n=1 Tax=Macrobrachium nipponense TaxID=159736 RepID=UPI0030C8D21D